MKHFVKFTLVALLFLFLPISSIAQEENVDTEKPSKIRPFRIGAKIGIPNLLGGNLEYVTPLLNHKLAVTADYSVLKDEWLGLEGEEGEEIDLDFNYVGGGINYYLFKPGKGLYAGVAYGAMSFNGTLTGIDAETGSQSNGEAKVDYSHDSFSVKVGAKWGGLFYFRPEIGYSFTSLPETIDIDVEFNDGSTESQTFELNEGEDSTVDMLFSGLIFNIGFGFAF